MKVESAQPGLVDLGAVLYSVLVHSPTYVTFIICNFKFFYFIQERIGVLLTCIDLGLNKGQGRFLNLQMPLLWKKYFNIFSN